MKYFFLLFSLFNILNASSFSLDKHFIFIDNKGILKNTSNKKVFYHQKYINNILNNIKHYHQKDKNCSLTLYIHGGLNTFKDAKKRSRILSKKMLKEGQYPLFISWEADPINNYIDHLFLLRNGERTAKKGVPSSIFVFSEDMLRSFARTPMSSWNSFFGQNNFSLLRDDQKLAKNAQRYLLNKQEFQFHLPLYNSKNKIEDFVTFLNPMKLITAPMIDGFGKGTWESMLRRTDLILNSQIGFESTQEENSQTAVYYLLTQLKKRCPQLKLNMVAHSMGTIIANNILIRFPQINYQNIVYMGSASSLKDLKKSVVPWLKQSKSHQFYNLTLHPYNDMTQNKYYDFLPRGSILIWIDEFLEEVHSFEDKRAGFWYNIIRSAEIIFPKEIREQVHLTKFRKKGNIPKVHKDFSQFPFWRETFWRGFN